CAPLVSYRTGTREYPPWCRADNTADRTIPGQHTRLCGTTQPLGRGCRVIALDVGYVFEVTGGPQALQTLLAKYGHTSMPAYTTVQMWKSRGVIPGAWIVPVI